MLFSRIVNKHFGNFFRAFVIYSLPIFSEIIGLSVSRVAKVENLINELFFRLAIFNFTSDYLENIVLHR